MSKKNYTVAIVVFVIAENKNRFAFSLTVLMLLLHVWFSAALHKPSELDGVFRC